MRLDLDGRATGALDEGLHRLYVLANAMRRSLPMHVYENVISVVTVKTPSQSAPFQPAKSSSSIRSRLCGTDSSATTVASLQVDSWRRTRACSASRCWRRSSNASEPGGAAASERLAWATMASAMERSPEVLG